MMTMNPLLGILILSGLFTIPDTTLPSLAASASKAPPQVKSSGTARKAAVETALRYADAIAHGDKVAAGQLDFACQYNQVTDPQWNKSHLRQSSPRMTIVGRR